MYAVRLQIETSVVSHLLELVDEADRDKNGKIDFDEWQTIGKVETPPRCLPLMRLCSTVHQIKQRIPMAEPQLQKVRRLSTPLFFLLITLKGPRII